MIKILFMYGLPGSGKTLVSHRMEELLEKKGFIPHFMDDKLPLDTAVWADVSRFLHDPSRRTPEGAVIGEHSIVHNPKAPVGRLRISFLDGNGLNSGHIEYFNKLEEFLRDSGPEDKLVAEMTPGVNDFFGDGKEPVIHSPQWHREQLQQRGLLPYGLIQEIIADDDVRCTRNDERTTYNIPLEIMKREFPNKGGTFTLLDKWIFGNRYTSLKNNGNNVDALMQSVDEQYWKFFYPRLNGEGQRTSAEFLNVRTRR